MFDEGSKSDPCLRATRKRNVLTSKVFLFSSGFGLLNSVLDFSYQEYQSALIDIFLGAILFFSYLLNRWRHHRAAKVAGLFLVNIVLVLYASIVQVEVGLYMYFFPLMAASSALFEPRQRVLRYFFNGLPFFLLMLLFATDFHLFWNYRLTTVSNTTLFFLTNSISSGIIMILCINFMITLNESSENELYQMAQQITAKNNDLEKANTELDRFLYSTSHDLRAPLSSIKGLVNVAKYDTQDERMHGYFKMMIDRVERLEYFIKDIIDYSKNARTELRNEPVDFKILVAEVTDNLKYVEGADKIKFKSVIEIPYPVLIDKGRLNVVVNNLLANAVKYHDLRKENRWIDIRVSNSNSTVKLVVSDNGTGISEEHQKKIFEMFYRGTVQSNGSGLGLYIVKQAVEKMQGTIVVQSKAGQGSSFFVTIPVA